MRRLVLAGTVVALLAACGDDDGGAGSTAITSPSTTGSTDAPASSETTSTSEPGPTSSTEPQAEGTLEVLTADLMIPWDLEVTPDGRMFVTERVGGLVEVFADGSSEEVRFLDVEATGEGGLLGLAVSPDYEDDGYLYAYYTAPDGNRIVRFTLDGEEEIVLDGIPSNVNHNGGVLEFGPDGMLYAGTGDALEDDNGQDLDSLAGKILRIEPDGSIPEDNPFEGSPVWSYGHRNVQGLAWDAEGTMYSVELGPDRDDEVNRIEPGENHGWPVVTGVADDPEFVDPIAVFQPDEASPSGATVVEGGVWDGDLVFAGLRGERLWRLALYQGEVVGQEAHLVGEFGRLRNIVQHPDGRLLILTSNRDGRGVPAEGDDKILSLVPPPPVDE